MDTTLIWLQEWNWSKKLPFEKFHSHPCCVSLLGLLWQKVPQASFWSLPSSSQGFFCVISLWPNFFFCKGTSHTGLGPTLHQFNLISTYRICNYYQIRLHSRHWDRTSIYKVLGITIQPIIYLLHDILMSNWTLSQVKKYFIIWEVNIVHIHLK